MNILANMSHQHVVYADHVNEPDKDQIIHVSCGSKYNRQAILATVHYNPQRPLLAIANAKIIEEAFNVVSHNRKTPREMEAELNFLNALLDTIEGMKPIVVGEPLERIGYSRSLQDIQNFITDQRTKFLNNGKS